MYNTYQPWEQEFDSVLEDDDYPNRLSLHEAPADDWDDETGNAD